MPRKQNKYHFIYKTINVVTGKYYYGMHSTNNLEDGYLGSGRKLRYSINKYGKENHHREILEFLNSRKELSDREEEIVNLNEIAKKEWHYVRRQRTWFKKDKTIAWFNPSEINSIIDTVVNFLK